MHEYGSQFVRGERKLACRDGVDLVRRRVLLARERGVSNTLLGDQRVLGRRGDAVHTMVRMQWSTTVVIHSSPSYWYVYQAYEYTSRVCTRISGEHSGPGAGLIVSFPSTSPPKQPGTSLSPPPTNGADAEQAAVSRLLVGFRADGGCTQRLFGAQLQRRINLDASTAPQTCNSEQTAAPCARSVAGPSQGCRADVAAACGPGRERRLLSPSGLSA